MEKTHCWMFSPKKKTPRFCDNSKEYRNVGDPALENVHAIGGAIQSFWITLQSERT